MKSDKNAWHTTPGALPRPVIEWLAGLGRPNARSARYFERAQRFASYWHRGPDHAEALERAWSTIAEAAFNADALIGVFATLPDAPAAEPHAGIYGRRNVDAGEERQRNKVTRKHIAAVQAALAGNALKRYAGDARATGAEAVLGYKAFAEAARGIRSGLAAFDRMLKMIEPAAKLQTAHYASEHLAQKNYRREVANLNDHLRQPQHAALSFIAGVNCPDCIVHRNTLSKIWNRRGDTR